MKRLVLWGCGGLLAAMGVVACKSDKAAKEASPAPAKEAPKAEAAPAPVTYDRVPREAFNRLAVEATFPLFWVADANTNNTLDPSELTVVWGIANSHPSDWVDANGAFTTMFNTAYEAIVKRQATPAPTGTDADSLRKAAVLTELGQGLPTALLTDFRAFSAEDKAVVTHVLAAADVIERLHARQSGTLGMETQIAADDTAAKALFFRNQGPWCVAPRTKDDPNCNALPGKPARISGVYPADIQADPKFCDVLGNRKDHKELMDPFVVVAKDDKGELTAVPYNVAYKDEMEAVSRELKAAADAVVSPEEKPFKTYLLAASQSFLDNKWQPADEAWSKMSVTNSKWYLRVAPDEVYWEPCSQKAGFHVSFARINQGSLMWQQKLDPVKGEMEKELATLAGPPYKARSVSFHLPDFIDVVLNAGDARSPLGATVGQSLPNWGPVANEGRGRTVVMVNFYTDPDSKRNLKAQVESIFCKDAMPHFTQEEAAQVMTTVLHEAAHNLGPAHEYAVKGKTDRDAFGGPMASMLEELKAQTSALYFTDWLAARTLITKDEAEKAHMRDVIWAMGHISRGMYDGGKPSPYSQLAAIEVGTLFKDGAVLWKAEEVAANGTDKGCVALALDKFPGSVKKLETTVLKVKATGDKKTAEALKEEFVDRDGAWKDLMGVITTRVLRSPRASFLYAIQQ